MNRDGYLRLTHQGPRMGPTPAEGPGALVFVDIEPEAFEAGSYTTLRDAPFEAVRSARWLLVRAVEQPVAVGGLLPAAVRERVEAVRVPGAGLLRRAIEAAPSQVRTAITPRSDRLFSSQLEQLREQVLRMRLRCGMGILHQPFGAPAEIEGDLPNDEALPERARAAELEALLEWGNAVWRPSDYHYRLPSGEHAANFVRVANSLQEPRDAQVLASWLRPDLADGAGLVIDTGTLNAVALAAAADMRAAGLDIGPVSVLDTYPTTDVDVRRAVGRARRRNAIVALLSVNSSGQVRDRLISALSDIGIGARTSLHVMLNKHEVTSDCTQERGIPTHTWHPRPGSAPLIRAGASTEEACDLCQDHRTSTLVPVSPATFDATLKAAVRTITPSVSDPRLNRALWELCDAHDAIVLETQPRDELAPYRRPGPMPIRLDFQAMLLDKRFRERAVRALRANMHDEGWRDLPGELESDVLLVPHRELALDGMAELIDELRPVIGTPRTIGFPLDESWEGDLRDAVRGARSLAVLMLGTVTGTHLYQALTESQTLRDPGELLTAIVLHPRMEEARSWETLENAYGHRLFYAWHSYLRPRSPIREEAETLDVFGQSQDSDALSDPARAFLDERRRFCTEVSLDESGLFWGSTPDQHLTPNSIYGEALKGPATYVAVASAMERARKQTLVRAEPERRVFEMDAIARSYYDPLILSSVLRWLEPHEPWWGWRVEDSRSIIAEMLGRLGEDDQRLVLVCELLLASAQGKLARPALGELRAFAEALAENLSERSGPLELGLALAPQYRTHDQERRRKVYGGRLKGGS